MLSNLIELGIGLFKGVCSLDGCSQAPMEGFMVSRGKDQYIPL